MLSNLTYSVNAVLPVFLLVVLGALLKRGGKINAAFLDVADWMVFKVALPVMLFLEVAQSTIVEGFDRKLIVFTVIAVTLSFLLVSVLAVLFLHDSTKRGAFIQGICRSNVAILGVPLAENMFGAVGAQTIALVIPFVILMFNTYSVIVLSVFSSSNAHQLNRKAVLGILKNIVTNPLILGVVLGLPFMLFHIPLGTAASRTLQYISNLTTPLALISLGANFRLESLRGRLGCALTAAIGKTVVLPALAVTAAALIGLRGPSLGVILICFGAPTAVASYIMSKKMDNDYELSAQILLLTTMMCILTIFVGIFLLKTLQLI
ncbi:MAG: AEC family transporter [Eubacteriales bacterium]